VPAERIAATAGVPQGYHLFFIDPAQIAERVQALPEIRSAEVRCALPGELTIRVWEREPVFGWRTSSETFWIDAEGVLMEANGDYGETLVVEEQTSDERQAGQVVGGEIVRALQQMAVLLPEVKRYDYGPGTGLSFQTEEGAIVFLGTQDLEHRVRLLEALLREASAQGRRLREVHVEYGYPMTR
jgi:cell division septal protein FtsQ